MQSRAEFGAVADLAARHHGVVTRAEAAALDIGPRHLRRLLAAGLLREPTAGILVVCGAPDSFHQRAMVASMLVRGRGAVAGEAAGALHAFDRIDSPARIEVLVRNGVRLGRVPEYVGVRQTRAPLGRADLIMVDEIECTTVARTLVDLAARHDGRWVEEVIDALERSGCSLAWLRVTAERLAAPGRPGPRLVLDDLDRRSERRSRVRGSWFQKLVLECLASPVIPELVEEYEVRDERGRFVARVDLAVPCLRLAIEAHSRAFHTGATREAFDEQRDNELATIGWDVRYVGYTHATRTPAAVRTTIEQIVVRRATDLGVALATARVS